MTVERARWAYALAAQLVRVSMAWGCRTPCPQCAHDSLQADAASIALDNAVAEASRERIRQSVAWG